MGCDASGDGGSPMPLVLAADAAKDQRPRREPGLSDEGQCLSGGAATPMERRSGVAALRLTIRWAIGLPRLKPGPVICRRSAAGLFNLPILPGCAPPTLVFGFGFWYST